jgi:hypothetical protein
VIISLSVEFCGCAQLMPECTDYSVHGVLHAEQKCIHQDISYALFSSGKRNLWR